MFRRSVTKLVGTAVAWVIIALAQGSVVSLRAEPSGNPVFRVSGPSQRMEMVVNTSRTLTLPYKIPRLVVQNQDLVDATPLSASQIQVFARRAGITSLNLWADDGSVHTVDVVVTGDARELERLLQMQFPDAELHVQPVAQSVILSGFVPSADVVSSVLRIAEAYYPKVINNLRIGGVQQIALKVKVMEVSRTKLRKLGFDWAQLSGNNFIVQTVSGTIGSVAAAATGATPSAVGTGNETVSFGIVDGNSAFFGFIEMLQQNNLVKVLAEPVLTTTSGRPASFHSGGEFPIIVPQSLGTMSIEYREFGTRLDFVPIVLGNGDLRLEVRPSVSEIDGARSATINGISVPGIRTRWVDTAVEMKVGQTYALAGLIQHRVEAENRGIPWLADLPWVGAAFRRVVEQNNEIELLIMITPEFVGAMDSDEVPRQGPGTSTRSPNDGDLYIRGRLEVPISGAMESSPHEESHTETANPSVFKQPQEIETVKPTGYVTPNGFTTSQATRRLPPVVIDTTTKKRARLRPSGAERKRVIRMVGPLGYESLR